LSGAWDATVRSWNLATGETRTLVDVGAWIYALSHVDDIVESDADACRFVTGCSGGMFPSPELNLRIWDAAKADSLERTLVGHMRGVHAVRSIGGLLLSASVDKLILWNLHSLSGLADNPKTVKDEDEGVPAQSIVHNGGEIKCCELEPGAGDGTAGWMAVAGSEGNVILFDSATGVRIGEPKAWRTHDAGVSALEALPGLGGGGSSILCSAGQRRVRVWDPREPKPLVRAVEAHDGKGVSALKSARTGRGAGVEIVSAGGDGALSVWDARVWREVDRCHGQPGLQQMEVLAIGQDCVLAGNKLTELVVWERAAGDYSRELELEELVAAKTAALRELGEVRRPGSTVASSQASVAEQGDEQSVADLEARLAAVDLDMKKLQDERAQIMKDGSLSEKQEFNKVFPAKMKALREEKIGVSKTLKTIK